MMIELILTITMITYDKHALGAYGTKWESIMTRES